MLNDSFAPWPSFTQEEADVITRVLLSNKVNYWTGTEGQEFEREFATWCGAKYAVALANGTVALDLALKALDIGPGDEVIVTPRTFIASVSCVVAVGAVPVFADVDADSQNISAETIKAVLTSRTKAIICVHLAGWPCDMDPIMDLARHNGLYVIEDCAQAHGARYKGRSVGSIGHIGAWSFCQDKIMSTGGEGGMLTTSDYDWWKKAWAYKDHGKNWEAVYARQHPSGYRWLHESFGTNFRLTEMQSAIGRIQLQRMDMWHEQRRCNAETLLGAARKCMALRVPEIPNHIEHAWYRCYVFIRPECLKDGWSRDLIIEQFNSLGIPCLSGSCPEVYLEKSFNRSGLRPVRRLPVARELGKTSLTFLVHPSLTADDVQNTCQAIGAVMAKSTKNKRQTI